MNIDNCTVVLSGVTLTEELGLYLKNSINQLLHYAPNDSYLKLSLTINGGVCSGTAHLNSRVQSFSATANSTFPEQTVTDIFRALTGQIEDWKQQRLWSESEPEPEADAV